MPPKGKKKGGDEIDALKLEEAARLQAEQDEEERQRRLELRKESLLKLYQSFQQSRFVSEETLSTQFNESLNVEISKKEERKQKEAWEDWMDQSGKPDCNSAPSISSFVSRCLENEVNKDEVFNERHLVHEIIQKIKHLSLDYPENRDQYHQAIIKLNEMQEERLDQLTLNYLLNPSNHIDPESEDFLYESEDDLSGLIYLMWGNFGKNPRRREITFENQKLKVELKKEQAIENVALRVIYTKEDTLNFKLPTPEFTPPLDPPVEDVEEEPVEEEVENEEKSETGESQKKEPSIKPETSQPAVSANPPPDEETEQQSAIDQESESETTTAERSGLSGKEGIGGVWHIEYLSLPPPPRKKDEWTFTTFYGDQLQRSNNLAKTEPFQVALPVAEYPIDTQVTVGRWDGNEWSQDGIQISEQKDGSFHFNTSQLGAFRFFVDRHTWEGPLIDTWMIRPNGEIIELFIIFQNFQIQFDILPSGKLNLIEKGETAFFPPGTERADIDLDTLVADLEQRGLFVFPNEESLKFLESLEKIETVSNRAYSNIASVAHLKRITSSSYNPTLQENEMTFMVENDTVMCTSDRFYIIEDKYIPPDPPNPPKETEEEDQEAIDAFNEEKENYDEMVKEQESKFQPEFEIPRNECPMLATLAEILEVSSRISQQNLTVYKLLKKSMLLQL